jgi:uncharacterized protein
VVNHLKSKGSACGDNIAPIPPDPDLFDGQGNCNLTRLYAANEMMAWLAGDPTGVNDYDVLILGDLNSYAKEDPITAILDAGYTNCSKRCSVRKPIPMSSMGSGATWTTPWLRPAWSRRSPG